MECFFSRHYYHQRTVGIPAWLAILSMLLGCGSPALIHAMSYGSLTTLLNGMFILRPADSNWPSDPKDCGFMTCYESSKLKFAICLGYFTSLPDFLSHIDLM